MITSRAYRDGSLHESPFDPGALRGRRNGQPVWLDVADPTDEELEVLRRTLGLHELAVEDSRRWGQRAKVDLYAEHLFVVAHGVDLAEDGEVIDREVHVYADAGTFLLTVRREPRFDAAGFGSRLGASTELADEGTGYLLYLVLDEIVDGYLDAVDRFEDLSDDVEDAVAADEDDGSRNEATSLLAQRIFRLRQQVIRFRRLTAPMREAVDLLLEGSPLVTPKLVPYYRDVLDHVIRTTELTDNVRDLLTSARELQLAQVSNRLNVVMKQLSAWAAIILIPTLIAGVYGMNFRHMPELDWRLGYPFAIGVMAVAAFALYRSFRKRDWL